MSHFQTIPKYLQRDAMPRVQDSAFPPFKIEHRYRGVYERAGFDVNVGGHDVYSMRSPRNASAASFSSRPAPALHGSARSINNDTARSFNDQSQRSSQKSGNSGSYSAQNAHGRAAGTAVVAAPFDPRKNTRAPARNRSQGDLVSHEHSNGYPFTETPPIAQQAFTNSSYPDKVPQAAVSEPLLYRELDNSNYNEPLQNHYYPTTERSYANQQYHTAPYPEAEPPIVISQVAGAPESEGFNFSPQPNANSNRNYMNLSLNLRKDVVDEDPLSDNTAENGTSNKANADGTMDTSVRSRTSSIKTDELLDSPHKQKGDLHSGQPLDNSLVVKKQRLSTALDTFKQDVEDHKRFQPPINRHPYPTDDEVTDDVSSQFQHFREEQSEQSNQLNSDYNQFLTMETGGAQRLSQTSMVSSILSKESKYDDEDSEVEKELERQLESLKIGGSSDILARNAQPYPHEFPEDRIEQPDESEEPEEPEEFSQPAVPTFIIQGVEAPYTPNPQVITEELDLNSPASFESIKPLSVGSKPKSVHLPDISQTPRIDEESDFQVRDPINTESPLKAQVPLIDSVPPEVKMARKAIPSFKYPAGSGPCRACNRKIAPDARGSQRAIYSKSGELTGQWHRSCFTCSHEHCSLQFDKSVQCFVLDDEPYCEKHYHQINNSICQKCQKGIEGECIENELEQKWHLRCLKCTKCDRSIDSDYYLINDDIVCTADAMQIISGQSTFSGANGKPRNGLSISDKIEKRRTRLMHLDM